MYRLPFWWCFWLGTQDHLFPIELLSYLTLSYHVATKDSKYSGIGLCNRRCFPLFYSLDPSWVMNCREKFAVLCFSLQNVMSSLVSKHRTIFLVAFVKGHLFLSHLSSFTCLQWKNMSNHLLFMALLFGYVIEPTCTNAWWPRMHHFLSVHPSTRLRVYWGVVHHWSWSKVSWVRVKGQTSIPRKGKWAHNYVKVLRLYCVRLLSLGVKLALFQSRNI